MTDKEELIFILLNNLDEGDFDTLISPEHSPGKDFLIQELILRDERWVSLMPLLESYLQEQRKTTPYFQRRKAVAWNILQQQIQEPISQLSWYHSISGYAMRIAAAIVLIGTSAFFYTRNYEPNRYTKAYAFSNTWKSRETGSAMILLPDSTRVWLNKNSSVSYIKSDEVKVRQVRMTGEAYFEVKSSKEKPFEVISDQGVIRVTGTHFFTGKDRENHNFYVDLREGKVSFQAYGFLPQQVSLSPRQKLVYLPRDGNGKYQLVSSAKTEAYLWLRKPLYCKEMPLPELISQMEVWYETKITLSGRALQHLHFSGTLSPEDSLQHNLEKLSWTSPLTITKKNNQYLIKSK
ncbi:FecR family protein [Pedobacter sp. AW31-3R]|uniref:FecR family protein n=1 Tax=Pedobacter sp. AW31-3R TaxID=3445781 RepID=UPI003FA116BD